MQGLPFLTAFCCFYFVFSCMRDLVSTTTLLCIMPDLQWTLKYRLAASVCDSLILFVLGAGLY